MSLAPIDFLHDRRVPRAGWMLLFAGVLALALAQWCDRAWTAERRELEQAQQARTEALRVANLPVAPRVPLATEQRLAHARAELARPWIPALRAIESASVDPVYVLALLFDPATGSIKLDAEAPSFEHALAFTQVLADGATLTSAGLASHEEVSDSTGARSGVRFTVLARWSAP